MDLSARHYKRADEGDFVKDLTKQKRSLGMVMKIDKETKLMCVRFPKTGQTTWLIWENYGHYIIV